jgi:hypothetical protein
MRTVWEGNETGVPNMITYDSNYKSPCLSCKYKNQACVYIMDGEKEENACMDMKRWIKYQKRKLTIKNTDIPCCDNCDCFEERDNVQLGEWITIPTCCGKVVSELTPMVTRNNGCLSHPLAREYINREVIKELEKDIKKSYEEITHQYLDQDTYREGIIWAYKKSIKLLKEGTK